MGARVSRNDFEWIGSDEPHATRRKLILAKYPQIKKLMTVDPNFKWVVTGLVLFQFFSMFFINQLKSWWALFICAYFLTGVINHTLMLAVHEISHGQAFGQGRITANKLFGFFANLPLGLPMSISFKKYHLDHHRYQGDELLDTDIPSSFETKYFTNTFTKILWLFLQPLFYSLRPFFVHPKPLTNWELFNLIFQLAYDALVYYLFDWSMLFFMLFSTFIVMGLHPCAGHFISEHYLFDNNTYKSKKDDGNEHSDSVELIEGITVNKEQLLVPDTRSYYGILNWVTFNVGYHVEHHDFPSVPATRLPKVREIAREFYEPLNSHSSWSYVLFRYIIDPHVGPFARVKRQNKQSLRQNENEDYTPDLKCTLNKINLNNNVENASNEKLDKEP